jgi:hypothetical protein
MVGIRARHRGTLMSLAKSCFDCSDTVAHNDRILPTAIPLDFSLKPGEVDRRQPFAFSIRQGRTDHDI